MPAIDVRHARGVLPTRSSSCSLVGAVLLLGACAAPAPSVSDSPTAPASHSSSSTEASASSQASVSRDQGWIADLERLVTAREEFHPDPWHGIERAAYVAAVDDVIARVGELSDDELLVETVRLAAMPTWAGRDGHGGIHPWGEGDFGTHLYPLRLYAFSDGIFVVDALPPYRDLIGDQLLAIGGHDVETLLDAVEPLVARDNHQQVLSHGPRLMVTAEVLHGLGLISDPGLPIAFDLASAGEVAVAPVTMAAYEAWAGGHHSLAPPQRPAGAAWLRRIDEPSWFEWQPEAGTLIIQYNMVMGRMPSAIDEIEARMAGGGLERIVVDVRHNGGGDNTTYVSFLSTLQDADAAGIPVYVIMGRFTFSAAGNFVTDVEQTTDAVFVGEDLGTSPNHFGDSISVRLEHSGLVFRVAPQHHVASTPDDPRITIEPDLPVPISSDDYFGDTDPAMEAILADS